MAASAQARWLKHVIAAVNDKFSLTATVRSNANTVVTFSNGVSKFPWVVASTPGDQKQNRIALATLRRGLRDRFGIESIQANFPLQMYAGTHEYEALVEKTLEREWSTFFTRLEREEFVLVPAKDDSVTSWLPRRAKRKKTFKKIED